MVFHQAFPQCRERKRVTAMPKNKNPFEGRHSVMRELADAAATRGQHFFYVRIPESLGPFDRGAKYEDPLSAALGELGEVTGGGSQLGVGNLIEYCGVDVVVNDRDRGLKVIRQSVRSSKNLSRNTGNWHSRKLPQSVHFHPLHFHPLFSLPFRLKYPARPI